MATRDEILRFLLEVTGEKDLQGLAKALDQVGAQAKDSEGEASKLAAELDRLTTAARGSASFVRLTSEIEQLGQEFDDANLRAYNLKQAIQATEQPSAELTREFKKASAEIDRLAEAQKKATAELQRVGAELREAGVDVDKLADEQQRLQRESLEAAKALDTQARRLEYAREAAERNAKALDAMGDAFQRIRQNVNTVGAQLLKVGAAAATAAAAFAAYKGAQFFEGSIAAARDLQDGIARIAAATGATTQELNALRDAAQAAGSSTIFTAGQAAEGLEILSKAGLSARDSIAALPQVLAVAQGQSISMAEAASLVADAVGVMGLGFEQSARAADVLAKGANLSNTTITQLGNALAFAGPAAKAAGIEIEEVVGILDVLAQNALRGEKAGTGLRSVLAQLSDPASKARRELAELGIRTGELSEVLDGLQAAGERGEKAVLAFGLEAGPTVRALVASGSAGIAEFSDQLRAAGGSAEAAAKRIDSTLTGSAKAVESAFEALRIAFVEPLLEPLQQELTGLAQSLRDFAASPEFERLRDATAQIFTAGIQAAKDFAAEVDFADAAQRISDFASGAAADFDAFAEDIRGVVDVLSTIGQALSVVVNAVETGVLGIAAAVSALGSAGAKVVEFQQRVLSVIPTVNLLAKALGTDLSEAADRSAEVAGGLAAVFEEFAERTAKNANETRDAIEGFGKAAPEAAEQTEQGTERIEAAMERIAESGDAAAAGLREVPKAAEEAADATGDAAGGVEDASARIDRATESIGSRLIRLRAELDAVRNKLREAIAGGASEAEIEALEQEFDRLTAAISRTEGQLQKAGLALELTGEQAQQAAAGISQVASAAEEGQSGLDAFGRAVQQTAFSLGGVSEEAARAFVELNKYASQPRIWTERFNGLTQALREQRDAAADRLKQLDAELAAYDPLTEKLEVLRSRYGLLDNATLLAIAEREERLAREQERVDRERDQVDRDLERVERQRDRGGSSGSSSSSNTGGGSASTGRAGDINIEINGFVGSLDSAAWREIARQLAPYLRRLDDRSA